MQLGPILQKQKMSATFTHFTNTCFYCLYYFEQKNNTKQFNFATRQNKKKNTNYPELLCKCYQISARIKKIG